MPGGLKRKCTTPNSAENHVHVSRVKRSRKSTRVHLLKTAKARKRTKKVISEYTQSNGDSEDLTRKRGQIGTEKRTFKRTREVVNEHDINTELQDGKQMWTHNTQIAAKSEISKKKWKDVAEHTQNTGDGDEQARENNQTAVKVRTGKLTDKLKRKLKLQGWKKRSRHAAQIAAKIKKRKRKKRVIAGHRQNTGNDDEQDQTAVKVIDDCTPNNTDSDDYRVTAATLDSKSVLVLSGDLADACLLFLKKGQKVCIKGTAQVKVLVGSTDVFGSILKPGHDLVNIFSAITSSLITFSECTKDDSSCTGNYRRTLHVVLQNQPPPVVRKALLRGRKAASILLMKSLHTAEMKCICNLERFRSIFNLGLGKMAQSVERTAIFLRNETASLGFAVVEPDARRHLMLTVPDQWRLVDDVLQRAETQAKAPVVLICGAKNVGKSTLARYLANCLLNRRKELYFLECDVGQTEFTAPGLISLNLVSSPLLGPPFTHLQQPERSVFFGDVMSKDKPEFYMQCIRDVYRTYAEEYRDKIPLIVNTQGWVKGMGVPLLIDVIRLVRPTHIIQVNYTAKDRTDRNLTELTTEMLMKTPGWVSAGDKEDTHPHDERAGTISPEKEQEMTSSRALFDPVILQIDESQSGRHNFSSKFISPDQRSLALLSYFSRTKPDARLCGPQPSAGTSLLSCVPYSVPWSQLAVHVMHTELPWNQILYSLNASVVALAEISSVQMHRREENGFSPHYLLNNPITDCIGLGIVRNIDPAMGILYVLTPLSLDALQRVNTLLKGNLEIPGVLLLTTRQVNAPYISTDFSGDLKGAGARRVRHNLRRSTS